MSPSSKPSRKRAKRPNPAYKTASKALSSYSPLAGSDTNVHRFVCNALSPDNWSKLSAMEQKELIDLMPQKWRKYDHYEQDEGGQKDEEEQAEESENKGHTKAQDGEEQGGVRSKKSAPQIGRRQIEVDENAAGSKFKCPLSPTFLQNDSHVKAAVGRFKRDVAAGCYEGRWQTDAKKAMKERREGKFNQHLDEHVQEMFSENNSDSESEHQKENDRGNDMDGIGRGEDDQSGSDWADGPIAKPGRRKPRSRFKS